MRKVIVSFVLPIYLGSMFLGFLLQVPQAQATSPSGLNIAPTITSPNIFNISEGDTVIGTVVATDQDNVVMEYGSTTVTGNTWKNISHSEMCNPVVVSSARSDVNGETQRVVRVRDKGLSDFDIKVDNQGSSVPSTANTPVDWIVVNAGAQDFIDDNNNTFHIQAGSESVSSIFGNSCGVNDSTTEVVFNPAFSSDPSVIHSISSNNGAPSIASSVVGNTGTYTSDPSITKMGLMMQVAFGSCTHVPEDVDYLATDNGHFVFGGVEIDAVKSTDTIASVTNTGNPVTFTAPFSSVPQTILTSMMGIDGANGGHGVVHTQGTVTTSTFPASVDEDGNTERTHTTEPFGALAFENDSGKITQPVVLTYSISGGADAADFSIDSVTGEITTLGDLFGTSFEIEVEVCDDHCNGKCSTQTVNIEVQGVHSSSGLGSAGNPITHISQAHVVPSDGRYFFDLGAGLFLGDIDTSQGDGWVLILQYSHEANTNPDLNIIPATNDLPKITFSPLGTDQSSDLTRWGHAGNAAVNQFVDATEIRWKASTSAHPRVIHFYSPVGLSYAQTGNGTFTGINSGFTLLSGHTANLPASQANVFGDQGDLAMTNFPWWLGGQYHWGIKGQGTRWEVDDVSPGTADTLHQAWLRADPDTTPPVITLNSTTPITIIEGSSYTDAGAIFTDDVDGTGSVVGVGVVDSSTVGSYVITYDYTDISGNIATQVTRTVNVVPDNQNPTDIILSANNIDENVSANTTIGALTSVDSDTLDTHTYTLVSGAGDTDNSVFSISGNTLSINISPDFETQSTYSIRVQTDDGNGGTYAEVFTININDLDEVAPVITLTGSDPVSIIKNSSYTDAGATCSDDVDVNCTVDIGGATVDTTTLGSYVISYDAVDVAGNNATQITRTVNVVAGGVPVITLVGNISETVEVNTTYTDAGATAADTEDGDITTDIVTVNPVDTTTLGSYTVAYDVTDSSDNDAIQVTRTVNIVDSTPPNLTLTGTGIINVIKNSTYTDAGATASDTFDGDITADIVTVNSVDTTTLGTYTITYNVSDSSGNAATQVTRTVNVIAGNVPVITVTGNTTETVEVNTTYIDAGATAADTEDGDITTDIITVNPVDTSTLGTYIVTYDVDDSSNNSAIQVTRIVNIVDTTAPVITLTGSDPITLTQGGSYSDAGAICSDNFDTTCSVIVGGDTVDPTRVGTYIITYSAVDTSGNNAIQITRTVNITPAPILINEVEYDTSGTESQSEWFELYNPTSGTVNIENWTITEAVGTTSNKTYTFGDVDIPAGGYLIVTNETTDFNLVYPGIMADVDLPGAQYFNLKNSPSDELELKDLNGNSIDFVRWEDTAGGWDLEAVDLPICRLLAPDTDTDADWSDECIPTPGAQNDFNAIPTDIILSSEDIDENNSAGVTVGTLSSLDTDTGDTHSYTLVSGTGDSDNASFSVSGNILTIIPATDYEAQQSYAIRLQTDDGNGGIYQEEFIININDINLAPTDIALTANNIDENNASGDLIGVLSGTDDGEDSNTLTYALVCNTPGADDASFAISGTNLNAAAVYDFETQSAYNICIQVSDGVLTYDENFVININDLDEVNPVVVITPVTKLQNSSITDTTIQITDDVGVNIVDISVDPSTTATTSVLNCTQTSATQVDCSISIDTSGDLVISALDTSVNSGSDTETNYVVDTIAPNVPSVSVDTEIPFDIDNPELTFSSLDNVGVDYYTVTYSLDDGGVGTGTLTTINPAMSPVVLNLDPDEGLVHTIVVTVYDAAGNSASTTIQFPPIVTINAPTTLSNGTITDSTVTISAPTGNDLTNITLIPNTTGASLGTCTGAGGDTTDPYATPVNCIINTIGTSDTITITAEDAGIGAEGINSQSYVIDTLAPVITITAPSKLDNTAIIDTTIVVTDETAIDVSDVSIASTSTVTSSSFSCTQTSITRVDCTISIDDLGDLTISADDLVGNNDTQTEPNYIIDTTPPVITLIVPSPETVEYLSPYTDGLAEFTDNVDGTGSFVGVGSVNTGILGSYILNYNYTDTAGNPALPVTRTVNVVDTTPPVVTLIGNATETVEVNTSYTDAGSTAVDNFDGNLTSSIVTVNGVDITTVGSYTVTYDVTDTNTNVATQITRTVNVVDTTPPVITLTGLDEIVLEVGGTYSELGATATDNEDTILPTNIVIDSSAVDVNTVGSYDVTYNVSDSSSNAAIEVIRTVTIQDTTIPVITLTGNTTETVEVNTSYIDAGATAIDNYDGNLTSSIATVNGVDITTVGSYTVTYDVIDGSSNAAVQVTRTVNIVDTTPPVITLTGNAIETIEVNASYIDAGSTATDNFDGNLTPDIMVVNPVDTTTLGTYTVTYNVTDTNTNVATEVTRTVEVVDTTPPVINLTGSSLLTIFKNAPYTEFGSLCSDNFDTSCTVTVGGDTVDTTTLGTYTITYDAIDTSTNIATQVIRTVQVVAGDAPVITLNGNTTEIVEVNSSYLDVGAIATDTEDGNLSSNIMVVNPVDITTTGTYTVTYNVTDSSDNVASEVTRTVNVVDTTPPVINLTGSGVIDIFKNATYTEFGAICADNYDATCSVTIGGDIVDTSALGTYTITYNVTDLSGNAAMEVTRTVNVIAGDIPVITLTGSGVLTHEVNTPYIDAGATANDSEDGNITTSILVNNAVDITSTGSYIVAYDVTDFSDNVAMRVTRTVNVTDTTAPLITLAGNTTETVNLGDIYTDAGAICTDNYDVICSVTVNNTVDVNTIGSYTIVYNAVDASGNGAIPVTRLVNVVTGNPPIINLIGSGTINLLKNTPYTDTGATASDVEDGDLTSDIVIVNPVDINTLGTYTISYNVTDSNLNSAVPVLRTVHVITGNIPTLSLLGANPVFVQKDDIYTDSGAIAVDSEDGDITSDIITMNPVDTSIPGLYTVSYNVSDFSDNNASSITRTVIVIDSTTDTDGDGLSDEIELIIGTDPSITDTDSNGTDDSNNDLDSISPMIELGSLNNGDGNNDGILDASQNEVSSIPNIENTRYNTLSIKNPADSCNQIQFFSSKSESDLLQQDLSYSYDFGLWDFEIGCDIPGSTADIQIYLDTTYDTSDWEYRKYDEITQTYSDISNIVSYTTQTVGSIPVTVINYSITDGGAYDEDGLVNGTIIDPSGPSVVVIGGGIGQAGGTGRSVFSEEDNTDVEEDNTESQSVKDTLEIEEVSQEVITKQEEGDEIKLPEKNIPEQGVNYTLENNFDLCPTIQNIKNPLYQYSEGKFSDIALSSYRENILKFAQIGIVDGYNDGSFRPYQNMTRTEFLKVALISHCYIYRNEDPSDLIYTDVDTSSWQAKVIKKAQILGMINGDLENDGTPIFRPNDIITKAEAIKILMRLSLITVQNPVTLGYMDITVPWHESYIVTGESLGLFESEGDNGKFYPDSGVRRQDMIDLIYRLVLLYK